MTSSGQNGSCCGRRTTLEKFLIAGSIVLTLAVIGLIVGIVIVAEKEKEDKSSAEKDSEICNSSGCVHAASSVLKNMDAEVDPCDDFYKFACGNFLKDTVIPDDKASVSSFSAISDELEVKLKTIITDVKDNAPKYALLTNKLYKSCEDEKTINDGGHAEIKQIIQDLGGWPVIDVIPNPMFRWEDFIILLRNKGYSTSYLVDLKVGIDYKDTTKHYIQIDQPSLGIAQEYLKEGPTDKRVQAYSTYMTNVAVLLGATREIAEAELVKSLNIEIELAKIFVSRADRRDYNFLYNVKPLTDIIATYLAVSDWKKYIAGVLSGEVVLPDNERINVLVPTFFNKLKTVLDKFEPRDINNYLVWRVVMDSIPFSYKALRDEQLKFQSALTGIGEPSKRWKECVSVTTERLSIATASLYVRKHFKEEARESSIEMVKDIRAQFKEILKTIDWMDEETRTIALDKAEKMSSHIAYPEELIDDAALAQYYDRLNFGNDDTYLEMILKRNKFMVDNSFEKLRKEVDKNDWTLHADAAVVNAFYNFLYNSIEFPAAILQGVFFNSDRPRYMNYGAIGFVIGHEITHGFDDQGRQFGPTGNLENWWSDEVSTKYKEKAKCIIDQYGNYNVKEIDESVDLNLNGVNTQGENIADNGGIKEAYLAYKSRIQQDGNELRLPGLDYTPEQMFWISAANVWCIKYTAQDLIHRVNTGVHSPGRFRVIGPMTNLQDFANDFNCKAGSKMNPEKKCVVW